MKTLLHIDASARTRGSISRELSQRFIGEWRRRFPGDTVLRRDLGIDPPPIVTEAWIAAAFAPGSQRTEAQRRALALSDQLVDEVKRADLLVIGSPMYNYGMPASLKAWFDQVIRVDETFSFDLARGDWPIEPIQRGKTLVLLTSRGEFGFEPGGPRAHMNFLDGHVRTAATLLGVDHFHLIASEYQEFEDDRHEQSKRAALERVVSLVERLASDCPDDAVAEAAG